MRFGSVLLLLSVLSVPCGAAPIYGWPLEKNYGISATFGESRSDHFHAGIDLSTNGDTGLPVLAIDAGQIYRMKVTKRGYGRALYIKHPDGLISVYGHLEGYSSELGLEQLYQQKARQAGTKYVGDIFVEPPISVERGTTVAYSGETGAGLPHLHLELRRGESHPVNPLSNGLEDLLDPVPPSFQAAYLYPATGESPIDGELETLVVRFHKKDAVYEADNVPVVRGDFFLSVSAYDAALRPYHRNPYRMSYTIDQQSVYQIVFNEFSYTEPEHFGLIYDLGKPGPAYYEYPIFLSNTVGIPLPFANSVAPIPIRSLAPGVHRLRIEASDTNGNASFALLDFVVNQPPVVRVESITADGSYLVVHLGIDDTDWKRSPPRGFAGEVEYSLDDGKTFLPFPIITLNLQGSPDSAHLICRAPLASLGGRRVLIKMRGYDGVEYSPYSVVGVSSAANPTVEQLGRTPQGQMTLRKYADAIKVEFNTNELLTYPLELSDGAAARSMNSWNLTSYSAFVPAPKSGEKLSLNLSNQQQVSIPVHYLQPGEAGVVRGENFEFSLDAGALYRDAWIWPDSLPAYKTRYLYPVGPLLQLEPRGLALKNDGRLSFHYPAGTVHPERLSVYRWSRAAQRWESQPSIVNASTRTVSTQISYLDLYALIFDNVAPVIKNIFPKRNSVTTNETPKLAAFVTDAGMDIDDGRITFFIDGVPHAAEYDPDRNLATLKMEQPLQKGSHRFSVQAYDWGGNVTVSQKVTFQIR